MGASVGGAFHDDDADHEPSVPDDLDDPDHEPLSASLALFVFLLFEPPLPESFVLELLEVVPDQASDPPHFGACHPCTTYVCTQ